MKFYFIIIVFVSTTTHDLNSKQDFNLNYQIFLYTTLIFHGNKSQLNQRSLNQKLTLLDAVPNSNYKSNFSLCQSVQLHENIIDLLP